jgi:hypothetical protein
LKNNALHNLKKETFWDVDFNNFELNKDKYFIIPRVLMRGSDDEIWFVLKYYSHKTLKNVLVNTRFLEKRTLNFCANFLEISVKQFRAYQ